MTDQEKQLAMRFLGENIEGMLYMSSPEIINKQIATGQLKATEKEAYTAYTHQKIVIYQKLSDMLKNDIYKGDLNG